MSAPVVFKLPSQGYQTILLLALFLWVDTANVGTLGARIRDAVGGPRVMDKIRTFTVTVHVLEALAMAYVAIKRNAPLNTTVRDQYC